MISMHSWVFRLMLIMIGLTPPVAVISGLGVAPLFILLSLPTLAMCLMEKNYSPFVRGFAAAFSAFFFWALISAFWTVDVGNTLGAWIRVVPLIIMGFMLLKGVGRMNDEQKRAIDSQLCLGMLLGMLMLVFEMMTQGGVVTFLRNIINGNSDPYNPDFMNRGLTFLVLLYWPFLLAMQRTMLKKHQLKAGKVRWMSVLLWLGFFVLLAQLESMAATVAFIVSTLVFLVGVVARGRLIPLLMMGCVVGIAATPILMHEMSPDKVMEKYQRIPASAEHRLYIWSFVLERAAEKPWAGWGFNSSPSIPGGDVLIQFTENGKTDDRKLLPAHPHNQVLQVWLELGYVGMALLLVLVGYGFYALANTHIAVSEKAAAMASFATYIAVGYLSYGAWQYWWICSGLFCWVVARSTASMDTHAHSRAISTN